MYNRGLALVCLLSLALTGGQAQSCDTTVQLESSDIVIDPSDTTCIECIVSGMVQTQVQWSTGHGILQDGQNGVNIVNGRLVVNNADTFVVANGNVPVDLECSAAGSSRSERLYLEGLFSPKVSADANGIVVDGGNIQLFCTNINAPDTTTLEWVGPNADRTIPQFANPTLNNVQRDDAGTYECRVTSVTDGAMMSSTVDVTVHYPPSITFDDTSTLSVPLNDRLSLSCTVDSVPNSDVTWTHNETLTLSTGNEVIIVNNPPTTILTILNVDTDSGGTYSCTASNGVGASATDSVTVTILIPPAPATNLMVSNIGETSVDLSWTNNFNGYSPIIGVTITVTQNGESTDMMIEGNAGLNSTIIDNLTPFTTYTFTLAVRNAIGSSSIVSMTITTLSLRLTAPLNVTLSSPTSTSLTLDWEPPTTMATTDPPQSWVVQIRSSDGMNSTFPVATSATTMHTFNGLSKGTSYSARVAGVNGRGEGDYSVFVSIQTLIDAPLPPQNLNGEGLSASAIRLSWSAPSDDGGRPITEYIVRYQILNMAWNEIDGITDLDFLLRNGDGVTVMASTLYQIEVVAVNEAGRSQPVSTNVATQAIDEPQKIIERPEATSITNSNVTISWEFPGGQVTMFRVEVKQQSAEWTDTDDVIVINVLGTQISVMITNLQPEETYEVRVQTENTMGSSSFSTVTTFNTSAPNPPTVSGPNSAIIGESAQINCNSPVDTLTITWFRTTIGSDGTSSDTELPATATVADNNLVFTNPSMVDSGTYVCRLGKTASTAHVIEFTEPPPPPPVSTQTLIIIGSAIGGTTAFVFLIFICSVICYCVC